MMETLGQDLRYTLRSFAKNPGFATIVAVTLALGIGANTAIFSVVHGVLLTPLPYPAPERVITFGEVTPTIDIEPRWVTIPNYVDWKDQSESFEHMALFRGRSPGFMICIHSDNFPRVARLFIKMLIRRKEITNE